MKRILFLGNGFDLAHGLPTRYTDFLYICKKYIGEDFAYDNRKYSEAMKSVLALYNNTYGDKYKEIVKKIMNTLTF